MFVFFEFSFQRKPYFQLPVDTGGKLNVHKTFRRRPGHPVFNLRSVPTG